MLSTACVSGGSVDAIDADREVALPSVLYLDHVGYLGGAELSLIDMVRNGPPTDHVILMSPGPLRAALEATGISVTTLPASRRLTGFRRESGIFAALTMVPQVFSLARQVAGKSKAFDIIWANSQKSFIIGCLAVLMTRQPLVWHLRDILSTEHFSYINRKIAAFMANVFASKVIVVSEAGLQSFLDSGGRPGLATVVYNGIDSKEFDAIDPARARAALCAEFAIGKSPVIGLFGRLTPWKGQHVLIEAMQQLPDVHAIFVGDSSGSSSEYSSSLLTLAENLGVSNRVHFIGFRKEIPELMSAVDLVVHTSVAPEPFGRVIVEAMLARKPVIATDAGGAQEIITQNIDGVLVPRAQAAALAESIRELLRDTIRARAIATRGYETATKRFSLTAFLQQVQDVKLKVCPVTR